ncbi:helix-turn-helix domain-containing protein [Haliea sp. E1-2-M8]|uniref:helix-turn-helix domain-containing protein n=1 Tax=Haliea sp. E1-2-M8 TaxID=3064706 RepID=UPI002726DFD0|nr:helix-turn-helix domain-containing protein [Haliea sp. E1-2-M8]MDO8862464.1 helix-turn-helix domain-containing protein [Haliea sp. E1-2-M8]
MTDFISHESAMHLLANGYTQGQLAEITGLNQGTVSRRIRSGKPLYYKTKSTRQIAAEVGVSQSTVSRILSRKDHRVFDLVCNDAKRKGAILTQTHTTKRSNRNGSIGS